MTKLKVAYIGRDIWMVFKFLRTIPIIKGLGDKNPIPQSTHNHHPHFKPKRKISTPFLGTKTSHRLPSQFVVHAVPDRRSKPSPMAVQRCCWQSSFSEQGVDVLHRHLWPPSSWLDCAVMRLKFVSSFFDFFCFSFFFDLVWVCLPLIGPPSSWLDWNSNSQCLLVGTFFFNHVYLNLPCLLEGTYFLPCFEDAWFVCFHSKNYLPWNLIGGIRSIQIHHVHS